jgi:DUF1680 family protein
MNVPNKSIPLNRIRISDSFWSERIALMAERVIPYQWKALNDEIVDTPPSHAVENFRIAAGQSDGVFHGMLFQDSDVAKWIEAASYSLVSQRNEELEAVIDRLIDLIAMAQRDDGYLNTYFTVAKPDKRWTDFSHGHELYCAGHLIEAAVAYYEATGKTKLLETLTRYVDYIDSVIGPEEQKLHVYCGHEEIELALIKLYRTTGNPRHLKLCRYFMDERGKQPVFLADEPTFGLGTTDRWFGLDYHQAHTHIREQKTAEGHAVRAIYLYCAMADLAAETGDVALKESVKSLWRNVVNRRMYVTGGIGSQGHGERFTFDYDLPNDVAYAETCAAIGLIFWAQRMMSLEIDAIYADTLERALYNGALSGISLDGEKYFYVNPLELVPEAAGYRHDHSHVSPERVGWFGCACCPPNIARLITSIGQFIYSQSNDGIFVHQYIGSEVSLETGGRQIAVVQKTGYPWNGNVSLELNPETPSDFSVSLRIPGWCRSWTLSVNGQSDDGAIRASNGYVTLRRIWKQGDIIELELAMKAERMKAHPRVRENAGKVAIQRGPLVYCLEEADNGGNLAGIMLPPNTEFQEEYVEGLLGGIYVIRSQAFREDESFWKDSLYQSSEMPVTPTVVSALPYAYWGNRGLGEMQVWITQLPQKRDDTTGTG